MDEARAKDKTYIWCDEGLNTQVEESKHLPHAGLLGELEDLNIKTRLIDEKFASVMGEYVLLGVVIDCARPRIQILFIGRLQLVMLTELKIC